MSSAYLSVGAKMRDKLTQTCPIYAVLPGTKVSIVSAIFASSKIIAGDFPPNSSVVLASLSAVRLITSMPI